MKNGGKRAGAGRPKGSKNDPARQARQKQVKEFNRQVEVGGGEALDALAVRLARADGDPRQMEALKLVFPFVFKKQPEAREIILPPEAADPKLAVEAIRRLLGF